MELCDINVIKNVLAKHGFRFSKSMGQNFLVQNWVPMEIADRAELDENTAALEIGPGIGCLTKELSHEAGKVAAIELDTALEPVLAETLADCDNVEIVFGDALKMDLRSMVTEKFGDMPCKACANLPYNITSPIITAFIEAGCFESMTLMVQREVARRICANAGTSDYGAFTVFCNWYTEPEILFDVSPDCFIPQPKVWSSVIQLKMRDEPPYKVASEKLFFRCVRASFNMRRKTLVNGLSAGISELTKEEITQAITDCGFDERIRGEKLGVEEFGKLSNKIHEMINAK